MSDNQKLNVDDVKHGINYVVTRGSGEKVSAKDFEVLFQARAKAAGLLADNEHFQKLKESDAGKKTTSAITSALDADGDGKITPKDFEIMFHNSMGRLDQHRASIDPYLPLAGQCCFGIFSGYCIGRVTRGVSSYKLPIAIVGFSVYSGFQYLVQQNFINQQLVQAAVKDKIQQLVDVNKDGQLDRQDVEELIEQRMSIVNTKLGGGGIAPGITGYITFGLGMIRGMRFI